MPIKCCRQTERPTDGRTETETETNRERSKQTERIRRRETDKEKQRKQETGRERERDTTRATRQPSGHCKFNCLFLSCAGPESLVNLLVPCRQAMKQHLHIAIGLTCLSERALAFRSTCSGKRRDSSTARFCYKGLLKTLLASGKARGGPRFESKSPTIRAHETLIPTIGATARDLRFGYKQCWT